MATVLTEGDGKEFERREERIRKNLTSYFDRFWNGDYADKTTAVFAATRFQKCQFSFV